MDQAFINEWDAAIDMYGQIFSGVTLVATTGAGLPNLSATGYTIPSAFSGDCPKPNMDCAAETTILSHFLEPELRGNSAERTLNYVFLCHRRRSRLDHITQTA